MRAARIARLPRAALCLLLCSCGGDLLVGEQHCYGDGVDCKPDAPTLAPPRPGDNVSGFSVVPSRTVEPAWVYEAPIAPPSLVAQLAPAPGGGVWTYRIHGEVGELERINAEGEPVELHQLRYGGTLSVDDELSPILLLRLPSGQLVQTILGPQGELLERTVGNDPIFQPGSGFFTELLLAGSEGRVRTAMFREQGSYLAEYSPLGELLWRQSEVRAARAFPFDHQDIRTVSYRAVALSDGAIALGVPKDGPIRVDYEGGYTTWEEAQGITLVEPDGNIRWDIALSTPTFGMLVAPGLDGSVVFSAGSDAFLDVTLIGGHGKPLGRWSGARTHYYGVTAWALCSDAAGDIYALVLTGDRLTPTPTVCRMRGGDPSAEVVCLGVEWVAPLPSAQGAVMLGSMTAPEPGAVVFAIEQSDIASGSSAQQLIRIEF
jgi:hypothetical protein